MPAQWLGRSAPDPPSGRRHCSLRSDAPGLVAKQPLGPFVAHSTSDANNAAAMAGGLLARSRSEWLAAIRPIALFAITLLTAAPMLAALASERATTSATPSACARAATPG